MPCLAVGLGPRCRVWPPELRCAARARLTTALCETLENAGSPSAQETPRHGRAGQNSGAPTGALAEMRSWATLVRVTATGMTSLPPVSHVVVAKCMETQAWRSSAPALSFTGLLPRTGSWPMPPRLDRAVLPGSGAYRQAGYISHSPWAWARHLPDREQQYAANCQPSSAAGRMHETSGNRYAAHFY